MARTSLDQLWATARGLKRRSRWRKPLPPLLFVTDPARTPDPARIAGRLPRGAGVVFRAFGAPDALAHARQLAGIARRRGLILLVGADEKLARAAGAQGLHLPERMVARAPMLRARHPGWLITAAAHSPAAIRKAARAGADAVLLSTVFESRSSSAGRPLGPVRLAAMARGAPLPVYALGGVDMKNARRLGASGVIGIAAVDAFRT
jgi:thiamine-phosphate pyrophosphorylase